MEGVIQACISGAIYAEYDDVIRRPRFRWDATVIANTLHMVREQSFWVEPTERIRDCSDPDDDLFLECAYAAQARYIITGNLKHFPASWMHIQIVSPRQFLDLLSSGMPT
jgi:putative PIN family toxin of toxin-antitoxin system